MITMKILLVEDNEQDRKNCKDAINDFNQENQDKKVELEVAVSLSEVKEKLDNSFDGAIIDLKLADQGNEGNIVTKQIEEFYFRIPVLILTGTPDAVDRNTIIIDVLKKGEPGTGYEDILNCFWKIYDTGLTRIMGGRGLIEKTLENVFKNNLLPQKDKWVTYGEIDSARTERALLRHTLSHLLQLLDDDADRCFPEEVYLKPPLTEKKRTGSVVKELSGEHWFVILNPACDLVIRKNGNCKTDRILLVEIEKENNVTVLALDGITKDKKKKEKLQAVFGNNHTDYYHWLPKTDFFEGGFLNFRKLSSLSGEEFEDRFEKPTIQISPNFVKDIVARFSAYYARQGQPDIDFDQFISIPETQAVTSQ